MSKIPHIDISNLLNVDADSTEVVQNFVEACKEPGFLYITNHGITEKRCEQALTMMKKFFDLSTEEKQEIHISKSKSYQGYFKLEEELTDKKRDWKEGVYIWSEYPVNHPLVTEGKYPYDNQQWPRQELVPEFQNFFTEWFSSMEHLGKLLIEALAKAVGFQGVHTSDSFMQMLLVHYPAKQNQQNVPALTMHTDPGLLIILLQDNVGGLQVLSKDNAWFDVPPIPGSLVVNLGDVLEMCSKGVLKATPHRVIAHTTKDRYSIPFFCDPSLDCSCNGSKIGNVKYGDYLFEEYAKMFPHKNIYSPE